jgi:hypothetical protein
MIAALPALRWRCSVKQGREMVGESTCGRIVADPDVLCGQPSVGHFMWNDTGDNGTACEAHAAWAMTQAVDYHPLAADCTMPGSEWHYSTADGAGFCEFPLTTSAVETADVEVTA